MSLLFAHPEDRFSRVAAHRFLFYYVTPVLNIGIKHDVLCIDILEGGVVTQA